MAKYRTVDEFLAVQAGAKREQIDLLRAIITSARRELTEHIKWNAPSYALDGEDRVTFNLMNKEGLVKLVLHMGATRKEDRKAPPVLADDAGLVAWQSDIRGLLSFSSSEEIRENDAAIAGVIRRWLEIS